MFWSLPDVGGSILIKVEVYISPETLFGVELASGCSEKTMPSVDVILGLGEKCGFGCVGLLPNEKLYTSSMKALRVSFGRLWGIAEGKDQPLAMWE